MRPLECCGAGLQLRGSRLGPEMLGDMERCVGYGPESAACCCGRYGREESRGGSQHSENGSAPSPTSPCPRLWGKVVGKKFPSNLKRSSAIPVFLGIV